MAGVSGIPAILEGQRSSATMIPIRAEGKGEVKIPALHPSKDSWIEVGTVASLHIHPEKSKGSMRDVSRMEVAVSLGITRACLVGSKTSIACPKRTFDHRTAKMKAAAIDSDPLLREVCFFHRTEQNTHDADLVARYDATPGLLTPGRVRANIEIESKIISPADLVAMGLQAGEASPYQTMKIGNACFQITYPRIPCGQMDAIFKGLQKLMKDDRQGMFGRVIESGSLSVGDKIYLSLR